jgi:hypothetical protein
MSHPNGFEFPPISNWKKMEPEDRRIMAKLLAWFFVTTAGTIFVYQSGPIEIENETFE